MAKYTEAQARSAKKYNKKFCYFNLRLTPEELERVRRVAEEKGQNMTEYIKSRIF